MTPNPKSMVAILAENTENSKVAGKFKVSATYVATNVSCPTTCALRGEGCYAELGNVGLHTGRLNAKVTPGMRPEAAARHERRLIVASFKGKNIPQDGAKGGRDLRMHVAGDARTVRSAEILATAADNWIGRKGGKIWSYTHAWKTVPRKAWGKVSVLASMEDASLAAAARKQGYAPALVVAEHPSDKAYTVKGSKVEFIPCPAQTREVACSECRLCMNADRLLASNKGIAFAAHGARTGHIVRRLPIVT